MDSRFSSISLFDAIHRLPSVKVCTECNARAEDKLDMILHVAILIHLLLIEYKFYIIPMKKSLTNKKKFTIKTLKANLGQNSYQTILPLRNNSALAFFLFQNQSQLFMVD